MTISLFIFGAGFSGRAIAKAFRDEAAWMGGTTRDTNNFEALRAAGLEPFLFPSPEDGDQTGLMQALATVTHCVQSIGPDGNGDPVLPIFPEGLRAAMPKLQWAAYLSTIGVYGNHDGAWIDETAECRPGSDRSRRRLVAEAAWSEVAAEAGVPLAILRLAGIYGPGRNAFVNFEKGTARRLIKPGQVFNRIHVQDIARATQFLAKRGEGGLFNGADGNPSPPQDVIAYAAGLMGRDPPPEIAFETADLSPMARSFYGENKRVRSERLTDLGFELDWPDYRTALQRMWREQNWQG